MQLYWIKRHHSHYPLLFLSRNKNRLIVKGLGQIGSSGSQRSPDVLRSRIESVLSLIGSAAFQVKDVVVYSASSPSPVYNVELDSIASVDSLLKEFFKFTRRSNPVKRPPELDKVFLYNAVTPGTRIRISILRVILALNLTHFNCFTFLPVLLAWFSCVSFLSALRRFLFTRL